jgi:uracil-DNA glycosylase
LPRLSPIEGCQRGEAISNSSSAAKSACIGNPATPEIRACRQWYQRELASIEAGLAVAPGSTAAQSVFGKITPIDKSHGRLIDLDDGTHTRRKAMHVTHAAHHRRDLTFDRTTFNCDFTSAVTFSGVGALRGSPSPGSHAARRSCGAGPGSILFS